MYGTHVICGRGRGVRSHTDPCRVAGAHGQNRAHAESHGWPGPDPHSHRRLKCTVSPSLKHQAPTNNCKGMVLYIFEGSFSVKTNFFKCIQKEAVKLSARVRIVPLPNPYKVKIVPRYLCLWKMSYWTSEISCRIWQAPIGDGYTIFSKIGSIVPFGVIGSVRCNWVLL